jgi:hypothetical protein
VEDVLLALVAVLVWKVSLNRIQPAAIVPITLIETWAPSA